MNVVLAAAARRDLVEILARIAADNPLAADRMQALFESKFRLLVSSPGIGTRGALPNTWELVVRKNYRVVYAVLRDELIVLRVVHTARWWPRLAR